MEENTSSVSASNEIISPEVDQFDVNCFQISSEYTDNDIFSQINTYQPLMTIPSEETQDHFFFTENDDNSDLFRLDKLDLL